MQMKLIFNSLETVKNSGKNNKRRIRKIRQWNKEKQMRRKDRKYKHHFNIV